MGPGLTLTPLLSGGEGGGHHRAQGRVRGPVRAAVVGRTSSLGRSLAGSSAAVLVASVGGGAGLWWALA